MSFKKMFGGRCDGSSKTNKPDEQVAIWVSIGVVFLILFLTTVIGPRLMTDEEMTSIKRQAAMDAQTAPEKYYESIQTLSRTEFAGEAAYELELVPKDGGETITQFYSVESGLLIGQSYTQATQQGDIEVRITMSDYREVGGIKMPFKSKLEYPAMSMSQELTISSIEVDKDIDAKLFEVPEEIKQLQEQDKPAG